MHVLILPISGNYFVEQIKSMYFLLENNYKADIIMSCSGGNVAAFLLEISNWNYNNILEESKNIHSKMICRAWSPIPILNYFIGIYNGKLNKDGIGFYDYFYSKYKDKKFNTEIWTSVFNANQCKGMLYCNMCKDNAILKPKIDKKVYDCLDPKYACFDIKTICKYTLASASVPIITSSVKIKDNFYVDGGLAGSSPYELLEDSLLKKVKKDNDQLHITYINSINFNKDKNYEGNGNILDNWLEVTRLLTRRLLAIDRSKCCDIIPEKNRNYKHMNLTLSDMKKLCDTRKYLNKSILEIMPEGNDLEVIDFTNFDGNDLCEKLSDLPKKIEINFWWEKSPLDSHIKCIGKNKKKKD